MINLETKAGPGLSDGGSRQEGEPAKTRRDRIFSYDTDYDCERQMDNDLAFVVTRIE